MTIGEFIIVGFLFVIGLYISQQLHKLKETIMADTSKLTASVAKLSTDVDALIAAEANNQPAIDAATAAVDAVDAKVVAATPTT